MLVLKGLFGGSLKITSENKIIFKAKKKPQKIFREMVRNPWEEECPSNLAQQGRVYLPTSSQSERSGRSLGLEHL